MDLEALSSSPIGRLVPIAGTDGLTQRPYEHAAFLPALLPADVSLTNATWAQVARAEAALARLDEVARQVPDPTLLRRPALRREAQSTSALEGTFAPFDTLLASETDERSGLPAEVREVLNYVAAAEEAFAWIRERPLTVGLIERLQRTLVADTPSERRDAGRIRERQVVIGEPGRPIEQARFVPPPPGDQLRAGVEEWLGWVRNPPEQLAPVARAAMAHYQFDALHPFSDGNGRIGRLLVALQLMQDGVLREPVLVVSPWLEARRREYQDGLLGLSQTGNWDTWIGFFASGVEASAHDTRARILRLLDWREQALERLRGAGVSGVAERVAADLIGTPIVRAPAVARAQGITPQGAMLALRRLAGIGLVSERRVGGRVVFVADDVMGLLRD